MAITVQEGKALSTSMVLGGRYELRSRLGAGGFGTVWEATDTNLGRTVAVKVLHIDAPLSPEARADAIKRFHREAQALAALNHPNVVTAHDFGVEGDQAYLVMELVHGYSIADEMRQRSAAGAGPYEIAEALRIASQMCAGLAAAHIAGLVHRDLKPGNIMLTAPGRQVKIVDFGLARIAERSQLTRAGSYLGTLPYIAPEQADSRSIDGRADIYSLGCVLHEMLAGRSPYDADSVIQWITAHQYATPAPLRTHRPDAPRALEVLIADLLAKRPDDRPGNAQAIAARLAAIIADLPAGEVAAGEVAAGEVAASGPVAGPAVPPPPRPAPPAVPQQAPAVVPPQPAPPIGVEPVTVLPQPQVTSAGGHAPPDQAAPRLTVVDPPMGHQHTVADTLPPPPWATPTPQWMPPSPQRTPPPPQWAPQTPPRWTPPPWPPPGTPNGGAGGRQGGRTWLILAAVVVAVLAVTGVVVWRITSTGTPTAGATPGPSTTATTPSTPPSSPAGPPPVPAGFQIGSCYGDLTLDTGGETLWTGSGDEPTVPCTGSHWLQVFSSGELPSSAASAPSPPTVSSAIAREAYQSCDSPARVFLGGDWRLAFTWMVLVLPDSGAWDHGSRWWACGLVATESDGGTKTVGDRDLADGLRGSGPAAMRCFNGKNDSTTKYETASPTGCTGHHFAEVVGVYRAPAQAWPGSDANVFKIGHKGCDSIFAKYVGVSSYGYAYMRSGVYYVDKESWTLGNRAFLCEAIAPGKSVSGSTKGVGTRHLGS